MGQIHVPNKFTKSQGYPTNANANIFFAYFFTSVTQTLCAKTFWFLCLNPSLLGQVNPRSRNEQIYFAKLKGRNPRFLLLEPTESFIN